MASLPSGNFGSQYLSAFRAMGFPDSAYLNCYAPGTTRPELSEAAQMLQSQPQQAQEGAGDRFMRLIHPVKEHLTPGEFMDRAADFFKSIGDVHVASVEIDGEVVHHLEAAHPADFSLIKQMAEGYIQSRNEKVREVRFNVFGKNDFFFLDLALLFRPVHSPHEPGLTLAIGMSPESLHAREGESFDEVSARNARLTVDGPERDQFLGDCRTKSQDLISDLSHHISSAFPGTKLKVLTEDESPV